MKNRKNKKSIRSKSIKYRYSLLYLLLAFLAIVFSLYLNKLYFRPLDYRSRASDNNLTPAWIDNSRQIIKNSQWFNIHQYVDCPEDSGNFWPVLTAPIAFDCLIADEANLGLSDIDKRNVSEPEGLYYKHFTPVDALKTFSQFQLIMMALQNKLNQNSGFTLEQLIQDAVKENPIIFSDLSVDSLYLGIEGGKDGNLIRSTSLLIHPLIERPISQSIGTLVRSKLFLQPYIEQAVGQKVSESDVHELYLAALNQCGRYAINDDQSGLGVKKVFGEYVAVVQHWLGSGLTATGDCNIHVVKRM